GASRRRSAFPGGARDEPLWLDATSCPPVVNCRKRGVIFPAQDLVLQLALSARLAQAALGYRAIGKRQRRGYVETQRRVRLDTVERWQRLVHRHSFAWYRMHNWRGIGGNAKNFACRKQPNKCTVQIRLEYLHCADNA